VSEERRMGGCGGRRAEREPGCYDNDVAKPLGIWFRVNSIF